MKESLTMDTREFAGIGMPLKGARPVAFFWLHWITLHVQGHRSARSTASQHHKTEPPSLCPIKKVEPGNVGELVPF